jgi:hypothetical protein
MTDDDPSGFDGDSGARADADADSDGHRGSETPPGGAASREDEVSADAASSSDDDAPPAVDEDLQDVVEYDLADLEEDGGEDDFPAMDDPVDPQSIDVEHATFVVLGVLAMVGLVLHLVIGAF